MLNFPSRRLLSPSLALLLLLLTAPAPFPGRQPSAEPRWAARAADAGGARSFALRRVLRFQGSRPSRSEAASPPLQRVRCEVGPRSSGAPPRCLAERFEAALEVGIERVLGRRPGWRGGRLGIHRSAALHDTHELVELRCDPDADGEITPEDLLLGESILAGLVAPTLGESLQLDVSPTGAPDGRLDRGDLAALAEAVRGERSPCEVPATALRRIRDVDADGVVRIGCLGDSNSCFGKPFRCGPIRGLCSLLQELSPRIATADGAVLPTEFTSYAWAGTTVCPVPDRPLQFGARGQYQLARARPGATDAVFFAFGTNDYGVLGKTPDEIVQCYQEMTSEADADGIPSWVAFTPPVAAWPAFGPRLLDELARRNQHARATNHALRREYRLGALVDFSSGFETLELFVSDDPLHLNDEGQRLRAERVLDALR